MLISRMLHSREFSFLQAQPLNVCGSVYVGGQECSVIGQLCLGKKQNLYPSCKYIDQLIVTSSSCAESRSQARTVYCES